MRAAVPPPCTADRCRVLVQLGEDVFTFVEGCKKANSCTVLITGPDEQTINQIKDAVHDGVPCVGPALFASASRSRTHAQASARSRTSTGTWRCSPARAASRVRGRCLACAATAGPDAPGRAAQASQHLTQWKKSVTGRTKLGVQAFADALLSIPRTLAENSGHDPTDAIIALMVCARALRVRLGC